MKRQNLNSGNIKVLTSDELASTRVRAKLFFLLFFFFLFFFLLFYVFSMTRIIFVFIKTLHYHSFLKYLNIATIFLF